MKYVGWVDVLPTHRTRKMVGWKDINPPYLLMEASLECSKTMGCIIDAIGFFADFLTIIASLIAIYLFFFKSDAIKSIVHLLLNYSYQMSLSEIKERLERLNDYNGNDPEGFEAIKEILSDLNGQIKGNSNLRIHLSEILDDIERLLKHKQASPNFNLRKRAFTSELREKIRGLNIQNYDEQRRNSK